MKLFDLGGKVAIVTGGNGGIGFGMARGLAEAGAHVVIAARNAEKSAAAVAEITAAGGGASAREADLRSPDACRALIDAVAEERGGLDILINNSGINHRKPPQDYTLEEWNDVLATNLTAPFVLSQAAYPHFVARGGGKIINTGSLMSFMGSPVSAAYGSSKGGILQLSRALAVAWARDNIQVNCILPGWIDTPLSVGARRDIPGLEESVIQRTPAGKWGAPADFAGAAVYLASAASDFVTGTSLLIDGGYSTKG